MNKNDPHLTLKMTENNGKKPVLSSSSPELTLETENKILEKQIENLHELTLLTRGLVVAILWLTIGLFSLWKLRHEIALWIDYFTWSAVRYALAYNRLSALGLGLCLGITVGGLVWESRNILWGISSHEKKRLEKQVYQILKQGNRHPLWNWIHRGLN